MSTLKNLKHELLVAGFIRHMEKEYKLNNIPTEINHLIYLFQQFCDEWSKRWSNRYISIDKITNTITFKTNNYATAFGTNVAKDGIYRWRIQIISLISSHNTAGKEYPQIGIIFDVPQNLQWYVDNFGWESNGYQLCGGTGTFWCINDYTQTLKLRWNKPNDILEIILDLNKQTLRLSVNDIDYGIVYDRIKRAKYRLALSCKFHMRSQFALL